MILRRKNFKIILAFPPFRAGKRKARMILEINPLKTPFSSDSYQKDQSCESEKWKAKNENFKSRNIRFEDFDFASALNLEI